MPLYSTMVPALWGAGTQQHAGRMNGQNFFDGWSNFKRLKNNEPPLVITYSSPMRIKLTAEVRYTPLTTPLCAGAPVIAALQL